jgi:hypothetical protein
MAANKFKQLMSLLDSDAAGSLEKVGDAFDKLTRGLTGFSDAANAGSENYHELLNGLTKIGAAFGELDEITKTLFGGTSKLAGAFGGLLKPLKLISQSVGAFAQIQRIFGELTGAFDSLSAGVRENYSEFHVLTNSFGGTYNEAKRLSVLFTEIQQKSGSKEFGFVSRKELLDTAKAMEASNLQIARMSEIIPSAGRNMDLLTTSVLQADAMSISITEHMGLLSSAIMKTGLSSDEAFKQLAGFKDVADETGLSTSTIATALQAAVSNFQQLGLSADFAKPLILGFAESLGEVGVGIENAVGLSQTLAKSLGSLGEDYGMSYLVSQLGGLDYGRGGNALSAGIGIQKAMLDADTSGDFESLGAELAGGMKTMLESFGGGEIVTVTDASNDPTKASAFYMQQQLLSSQFSMSQSEATRTLEMLQGLDDAVSSGDTETAKKLREQIADQKSGRNDTISLMEKQNIHTAGIFAQAQMQTRMQAMMLRNEAGGEMLVQMNAEANEMANEYLKATKAGLGSEYIKNAADALRQAFQGGALEGRGKGADAKATVAETGIAVVGSATEEVQRYNPKQVADEFKIFFDDLKQAIWGSAALVVGSNIGTVAAAKGTVQVVAPPVPTGGVP